MHLSYLSSIYYLLDTNHARETGMEIKISESEKNVLYVSHRNESIRCPTSGYFKKLNSMSDSYAPLNEYWGILPLLHQDAVYTLYIEAQAAVEEANSFEKTKADLTDIVRRLFEVIDYTHLTTWVLTCGGVTYNGDISTTYSADYEKRLTYLKDDYDDLVVLSIFFKMLTPIWGLFSDTSPNLDTGFKEINALEMMDTSGVNSLPAMVRLRDYCDALVTKNKKGMTPAIIGKHIGISEVPKYFLALAVVRRLAIGDIRNQKDTLIKLVYKFLKSNIENLSKGVRDKRGYINDPDDPESVAEKYRISQKVPDNDITTATSYISNVPRFVKDLNPEGNVAKATKYIRVAKTTHNLSFGVYHLQFIGLVCDLVVSTRTIRLMDRDSYLTVIGVVAANLSDRGYQTIANLLLSPRFDRDPDAMEMHAVSGFAFSPLTKENRDILEGMYSNQQLDLQGKSKGNPGVNMIDAIVTEINSYNWDETTVVPQNLKNEITTLLVEREARYAIKHNRAS